MPDVFNTSTLRGNERVTSNQLQGPAGSVVTYGTAAPNNANGADGDVYLLESNDGVVLKTYQKAAGVWLDVGSVNPSWTSYTPTIISGTGTITSYISTVTRYQLIGKVCFVYANIWINLKGTGGGSLKISLPVDAANLGAPLAAFSTTGGGVGGTGFIVPVNVGLLAYPSMWVFKYDGTTIIADSAQIFASTTYETV